MEVQKMEEANEYLNNADIAFNNKQYVEALDWYRKALDIDDRNIYALSRVGAICALMGKFNDAIDSFSKAKGLNPENGDNAFNCGNAYFFNKNYKKAFEQYVEAEKAGCSDDVKPRLYYQMALLCSMRKDIVSSLVYFKKCEESDKTGKVSLNPDLISEKLKLYMFQQDFTNAEKCAAQLVALKPRDFKGYMVRFSILMAHADYSAAERVLADAKRYAEFSDEDRFTLVMQAALLHAAKGENEKAVQELEEQKNAEGLTNDHLSQLLLALAEAYSKCENYDKAIAVLRDMLAGKAYMQDERKTEDNEETVPELTPEELEKMIQQNMDAIQEKIDSGKLEADLGLYAHTDYDEEGRPVHRYDENIFAPAVHPDDRKADDEAHADDAYELPEELRQKVIFTLLSCYLAKDEFAEAQKLADELKNSNNNKYYRYFGIYTSAMTERKLHGDSDTAKCKYAKAIAFFRKMTFEDTSDVLACVFRARLYAEQGNYEKASEIACLLDDADRNTVLEYIENCRHVSNKQ